MTLNQKSQLAKSVLKDYGILESSAKLVQEQLDKIDFFTMMVALALAALLAKHILQEDFQMA